MYNNDKLLFERITRNDQVALETLHKRYYQTLCSFALSYVKSVDYAEEVVSDVFLNIWLKRDALSINANIKPYLFSAVKNQSINFLNAQKLAFEKIEENTFDSEFSDHDADAQINFSETLRAIEKIIQELPPQRQTIFRLNRIDGLKYKEIADLLSISVNTVQKQMTEAIKHISKYYPNNTFVPFC